MQPAETRRPGRPTRLTPELAQAIVEHVAGGSSLVDAASAAGISERTLRSWRQRASSTAPADLPFVQLERGLVAALATARPIAHDVPSAARGARLPDRGDEPR